MRLSVEWKLYTCRNSNFDMCINSNFDMCIISALGYGFIIIQAIY